MRNLISVIVPVYNTGKYLEKCVESIVNQDYLNIEVILVDDGSQDEFTLKICDEISTRYKNVVVFHKDNGGSASARNFGLKKVKGEYVGFVDSDDVIDSNMFSVLFSLIKKYQTKVSVCGIATEENGHVEYNDYSIKDGCYERNELMHYFLLGHWHSACTSLYLKTEIDNILFPEGEVNEDYMFNYMVMKKQDKLAVTNIPLYHYQRRNDSNTGAPKTLKFLAWIRHTKYVMEDLKDTPTLRWEAEYQYLFSNIVLGNSSLLTLGRTTSTEASKLYRIVTDNLKDCKKMLIQNKFLSFKYRLMGYALSYVPQMYKFIILSFLKFKK